jgi:CheY-like chemotaxis protein
VVDDEAMNRKLFESVLIQAGFDVVLAENGEQVLPILEQQTIDLVLMDLVMPGQSGDRVVFCIREQECLQQRPKLPIIMVSASATQFNRKLALDAQCDAFLEKPIQIPVLLSTIADCLKMTALEAPSVTTIASPLNSSEQTYKMLAMMPMEWIEKLHLAALRCNNNTIDQLVSEIPEQYQFLQQQLASYSYNIQTDKILALTQQYLDWLDQSVQ